MEELLDFLCGDKDYCIIRCKQFTRRELREMFTKEETMRKDFENMCGNYWYAIRFMIQQTYSDYLTIN